MCPIMYIRMYIRMYRLPLKVPADDCTILDSELVLLSCCRFAWNGEGEWCVVYAHI